MAPMNESAIGVFDSGVGGLTVLKELMRRLPRERFVYLGDTARVPYGTRSPEVVVAYSMANANFLCAQQIKLLVVACNTASAAALPALSERLTLPVLGVIEPGAEAAARVTRGRVGVIGTPGTIASGAYQRALEWLRPGVAQAARACPLFVPLVEEGWLEGPVVELVAERYLAELVAFGIDTLVLGCTHYPLLARAIGRVMGPDVRLIDSASATAAAAERLLLERGLAATARESEPRHRYFVTDLPERFGALAERFLEQRVERLELVDLIPV